MVERISLLSSNVTYRISILLASLGFFIANMLSAAHASHMVLPCFVWSGCEKVTNGASAVLFGVPIAFLGATLYCVLILTLIAKCDPSLQENRRFGLFCLVLCCAGALVSLVLQFYSLVGLRTLCVWCLASALILCVLAGSN